ncbi:MAG: DMT family transporter [Proteobacteria bacterium]|nr:DMT family transporter [Pseudomonadota bacterium]
MLQQPRPHHWLYVGILASIWGFAFFLIAIALRSFPPITLVTLRLVIGAVVLFLLMRWQGLSLPREPLQWWYFSVLAIQGNLIPFSLISWAETQIPSSQAGLIMALMPISTMVLAHYFVPHEQLTSRRALGVVLGFGGVVVLMGSQALGGIGGVGLWAQLACVLATFAYAVNTVYAKRLPKMNGLVMGAGSLIAGSLIFIPVALIVDQPWTLQVSTESWLSIVALGALATGLATWLYFLLINDCGPNFLSIINYLIPVISFGAGVVLLSEPAQLSKFIGLIFVFFGIAISQPRRRSRVLNSPIEK